MFSQLTTRISLWEEETEGYLHAAIPVLTEEPPYRRDILMEIT